jgi:hypothetical protein
MTTAFQDSMRAEGVTPDFDEPAVPVSPLSVFLRALAAEIDGGAPAPASMTRFGSRIEIQLETVSAHGHMEAALAYWARILDVSEVKVEHRWTTGCGDRYSVEALFAGYRLEVWNAWKPAEREAPITTHIPVAELDPPEYSYFGERAPGPVGRLHPVEQLEPRDQDGTDIEHTGAGID